MSDLAKKLRLQSGQRALILNAPEGFRDELGQLPDEPVLESKPESEGAYDFVHLFAANTAELEQWAPAGIRALKPGGLLWMSYPKGTSKVKTDLNRDAGWDVVHRAGFEGVSLISIDGTWSAMRFRPAGKDPAGRERPAGSSGAGAGSDKGKADRKLDIPEDLIQALVHSEAAAAHFNKLSYSHRKEYVQWITSAKREETRSNRVRQTIEKLEAGRKNPADKGV